MTAEMRAYAEQVKQAIAWIDFDAVERVVTALEGAFHAGRRVFTLGNGASAALAAHMACDLGKGTAMDVGLGTGTRARPRLKIVSLVDNAPLLTALSNDVDYQDVFVEQLKNLLAADDIVIGISGSGGSPNVLRALRYAQGAGATTIGFTGSQPRSQLLAEVSDILVRVPLTTMEPIEDVHVVIHHMITTTLRTRIRAALEAVQDGAEAWSLADHVGEMLTERGPRSLSE